ncbi:carbohydrate binding domain-containing protein [Paraclostridium bifermentans]|uniref:carbohydrate binding domain-containing protein n=1 Tax=Paraclostridium bifermentans TaxID=1490 RepID=UPI00189D9F57|nr:family 16 glycosylhydrolase [Paraclostridium bifermentans]
MKKKFCNLIVGTLVTTMMSNIVTINNAYADDNIDLMKETNKNWNLVWEDNFDGDSLNMEDWNYETHEPGWVNNELQEYTDSTDNIYVKDGELVLKAIKDETEDGVKYTSGKVTTQNKRDYKYGRFEARLKVPEGQGLWPAFWMMPTDENLYGSWPRCGEIDIMEVLGHEPEKAYGTIHYGNPHREQQGTYILDGTTFADDYHVFSVEWEPSEMRFYIDGNLYHTVNDWYTKQEGDDEKTYPAPFDQPFYLQFNLAVGGNWPGNPDETTDFENAELKVDYVKVYQLDSYDENVTKPEKEPVDLRDPDATGNYINNGDFSVNEDLTDNEGWIKLTTLGGRGESIIENNKIILTTEEEGSENYSLQLVQPSLPLKQYGAYRISFDARADEDRTMIVNVTSPDRGYVRQFEDTTVNLTNELQSYSYDFIMKDIDEANGRLEFNYGNQGSLANIEISNVRLEKIGQHEAEDNNKKTVLPDGNYVYNGTFDVGQDRMKYWDIESTIDNVSIGVPNINNLRELKVDVKENPSSLSDVIVKQTDLAIAKNKEYTLSFDAYGEEDKTIKAQINGESFEANITTEKTNFKYKFKTGEVLNNSNLELLLGAYGVTYIDNVRIEETGLITNGDFGNGFAKWELFADSSVSSKVSSSIDNSTGDPSARIDIQDTGDADWKIQLKQSNVKLEKGKKYVLSLDAKSTIDRSIMFTIQRDGSSDNDWRPYSPNEIVELKGEYNKYQVIFEMTEESDENSIFSIAMGAVNGTQITDEHSINIDNVKLEEYIPLVTENLLQAIEEAKEIVNSDTFSTILEEDRRKLVSELEKAEEIYNSAIIESPSVTQEDIDKAEKDLRSLMENLRENEDEEDVIVKPDNSDVSNNVNKDTEKDNKEEGNKNGNSSLVNTGNVRQIIFLISAILMCLIGVAFIKKREVENRMK